MKNLICVLILICAVFMACKEPNQLAIIDITNASNLFIAPASNSRSSGRAAGNDSNKLFKITKDGYVQEVTYKDERGKTITEVDTPSAVYNVNDDYVIVCFNDDREGYLTRKSDGAVFELPSDRIPFSVGVFKNAKLIQTDKNGDIYYPSNTSTGGRVISKLNVSNPNNIVKTDYLPPGDKARNFVVNPDGHMIYDLFLQDGELRIKKSNGGLYNVVSKSFYFYIGLDGDITVINNEYKDKYVINSSFDVIRHQVNFDGTPFVNNNSYFTIYFMDRDYLMRFEKNIFVMGRNHIYEIEGGTKPLELELPLNIKNADKSDSYIYASGNDVNNAEPALLKINPITGKYQYLLKANLYDVYNFSVSNDDIISFAALRMNDGAKVIGTISSTGEVGILSTEFNTESIILERIN